MKPVYVTADYQAERVQQCGSCGSIVPYSNRLQHDNFHLTFSNRRDQTLSKVSWCDYGNHAFKASEPGSSTFQGSQVDEKGMTQTVDMDACRDHNPMRAAFEQVELKALTQKAEAELSVDLTHPYL